MKALIAMSGGVDSSVAAFLTKQAGFDCIGCTMKLRANDENEENEENAKTCCTLEDAEDARSVAVRLGIPFYVFDFSADFRKEVVDRFISAYEKGETPNPCIDCNKYMKFERLFSRAETLGCDKLVTGHYARVVFEDGRFKLKKALDQNKDQSYVLYALNEEQLSHVLFPLGELRKEETRRIAETQGFLNARKKDSQDLCFVPDGDYAAAIERFTGKSPLPGNFVDQNGKILGRHKGIVYYTVGQHKGLGLVTDEPLYVKKILPQKNEIVLCRNEELFEKEVFVRNLHFIGKEPDAPFYACVKVRYRHKEQPAAVCPLGNGRARIVFEDPQRAPTPGQAAVFYRDDEVLGGGIITQ